MMSDVGFEVFVFGCKMFSHQTIGSTKLLTKKMFYVKGTTKTQNEIELDYLFQINFTLNWNRKLVFTNYC